MSSLLLGVRLQPARDIRARPAGLPSLFLRCPPSRAPCARTLGTSSLEALVCELHSTPPAQDYSNVDVWALARRFFLLDQLRRSADVGDAGAWHRRSETRFRYRQWRCRGPRRRVQGESRSFHCSLRVRYIEESFPTISFLIRHDSTIRTLPRRCTSPTFCVCWNCPHSCCISTCSVAGEYSYARSRPSKRRASSAQVATDECSEDQTTPPQVSRPGEKGPTMPRK